MIPVVKIKDPFQIAILDPNDGILEWIWAVSVTERDKKAHEKKMGSLDVYLVNDSVLVKGKTWGLKLKVHYNFSRVVISATDVMKQRRAAVKAGSYPSAKEWDSCRSWV